MTPIDETLEALDGVEVDADIRKGVTPEMLREFIDYDPETGILTWRPRAEKWFKSAAAQKTWNSRLAYKPALATIVRGRHSKTLYMHGGIFDQSFLAHRVAWAHYYGEWPKGPIDHLDGNGANNRIANLRKTTNSESSLNKPRQYNNTSGVTGVFRTSNGKKWGARIGFQGRREYLGRFDKKEDAIAARKAAEKKYGFHPNHGREPLLQGDEDNG